MLPEVNEVEVVNVVQSLIGDIFSGKFFGPLPNGAGHNYDKIRSDERFPLSAAFLREKYEDEGYGVAGLIKEFGLPTTYPALRMMILKELFGFPLRRGSNVITDRVRELRRTRAVEQANDPGSTFGKPQTTMEYTSRGIQGYYISTYTGRKHWLRSTYEYIFAKWLDKQKVDYDVEVQDFRLPTGEMYRPDFFLYDEDGKLAMIVEVKGYWLNRVHKPKELSEMLGVRVAIVTDILSYTDKSYDREKREWKQRRLKE